MVLQLIQTGFGLPVGYPLDPTSEFRSGMIGQLTLTGNDITLGVSDGSAPFGIIDDERSQAFTQAVVDEVTIIESPVQPIPDGYGNSLAPIDISGDLRETEIVRNSFIYEGPEGLILNERKGVLVAPAGTRLNHDEDGDGYEDSIKVVSSYIHQVAGIPGDDSTIGSGRVTIWFQRGIFATDQFDTTAKYPLNATLYVSPEGLLTTKQATPEHPGIAIAIGPPNALVSMLTFLWL